ncbi:chemotaxis protein CheA [Rhodobacteraceae bacterium MCCB 386]|nr:chemotaxis protein CheA [Roseitranquillus sediminis]
MEEIRASFFIECEELLEAMQDGLQMLEDGAADGETINVVFRAVHSIKGGAGAFGLDALVAFAHTFETALDGVRSGRIDVDGDRLKLFFRCGDLLADHVRATRDGETLETAAHEQVVEALEALGGDLEEEEIGDFQPMAMSLDLPGLGSDGDLPDLGSLGGLPDLDFGMDFGEGGATASGAWLIRFAPKDELYSTGNEPLYLLRALADLGEVEVTADTDRVPDLDALDPAAACISWTILLTADTDEATIREVFDFVDGLCELSIKTAADDAQSNADALGEADLPLLDLPVAEVEPEHDAPAAPTPEPEPVAVPESVAVPVAVALAPPSTATRPALTAAPSAASDRKPTAPHATVRVDLERIDRLVNLVGELVINQAMLSQSVREAGVPQTSPASSRLDEFLQLTRDIQECVMMIRAQPVKSLFQRMGRIVREAAAAVGKDVRLHTDGEATEIDKTVVELLAEPLMHMIRNAVDHGLEKTEARIAAGKSPEGLVTLSAGHRSGRVVIEIGDDGAGINRARVLKKAIEKKLIPADAQLTESEIDNLLFMPGFSTAAEVTSISGRGVGMDVVRTAIVSLGGRISITSREGAGTTFSISLPLTLAVLDGMVVRVEEETLVIPLAAIVETLTLNSTDVRTLGPETQVVRVRDAFLPLLDLGTELGYRTPRGDYSGAIVLLITQEDNSRTALVVDAIEDQRQVVIKGLHDSYGHVPGVAAATILGDGQIALILDPIDLIANASGRSRISTRAELALAG